MAPTSCKIEIAGIALDKKYLKASLADKWRARYETFFKKVVIAVNNESDSDLPLFAFSSFSDKSL
jgi:hypothetical protein